MTSFHIRHYVCSILEWGTLLLPGVWYWWRAKSESIFRVGLRRAGNEAAHDIPKTGLAAPINPHSSSSRFSTSSVFEGICSGLQRGGTVTQRAESAQERKGHKKKGPNTRERPLWKVDRCSIFSGCFYSTYFLGYYTLYIIQPNLYTALPPLNLFYAQAQIICQLPSDSCSWSGRYLFVVENNGNKFQDWVLQRGLTYQI